MDKDARDPPLLLSWITYPPIYICTKDDISPSPCLVTESPLHLQFSLILILTTYPSSDDWKDLLLRLIGTEEDLWHLYPPSMRE